MYRMLSKKLYFVCALFALTSVYLLLTKSNSCVTKYSQRIFRKPDKNIHGTPVSFSSECGQITTCMYGRLGSQMQLYASLFGMALANKKYPFFDYRGSASLRKTFDGLSIPVKNESCKHHTWMKMDPQAYSIFSTKLMHQPCGIDVWTNKEVMSWKYWWSIVPIIRKEFSNFNPAVLQQCTEALRSITTDPECILVGAHLRREDFTSSKLRSMGFVPAEDDLLERGIRYFDKIFLKSSCVRYVVLGTDYDWNSMHAPVRSDVIVLKPTSPSVDFCILSKCNHSIRSTGSFGIMSAFLADGITLHQSMMSLPGSFMNKEMKMDDYVFPGWIAI